MNYLCLLDGVVEYASTSESSFAHYQLMYAEEHQDADVQYLTLTDEEYDELFPVEDEEWNSTLLFYWMPTKQLFFVGE